MSNGFEMCDQHVYLFATEGKDCPYCEIDRLTAQLAKRDAEIEQLRVQLAGCGVAAMCNTRESMQQQLCRKGDYGYSASYQDVVDAVSREIALREEVERLHWIEVFDKQQLQQAHRQGWEQGMLRAAEALCKNCEAEGLNVLCDLCTDVAAIRKEMDNES